MMKLPPNVAQFIHYPGSGWSRTYDPGFFAPKYIACGKIKITYTFDL